MRSVNAPRPIHYVLCGSNSPTLTRDFCGHFLCVSTEPGYPCGWPVSASRAPTFPAVTRGHIVCSNDSDHPEACLLRFPWPQHSPAAMLWHPVYPCGTWAPTKPSLSLSKLVWPRLKLRRLTSCSLFWKRCLRSRGKWLCLGASRQGGGTRPLGQAGHVEVPGRVLSPTSPYHTDNMEKLLRCSFENGWEGRTPRTG